MSNPHLAQIHALHQNARRFWVAWQQQEAQLVQLSDIEFVEQANDLLRQFCPSALWNGKATRPIRMICPAWFFIRRHP